MRRVLVLVVLVVAVVVPACGGVGRGPSLTGVVVDVDGDLEGVERFTLLTDDGTRIVFFVTDETTFHGGPLSHLREHITSGEPVRVGYEKRDTRYVALSISDG